MRPVLRGCLYSNYTKWFTSGFQIRQGMQQNIIPVPTSKLPFKVQFFAETYFRVFKSFAKIAKIRSSRKFPLIRYLFSLLRQEYPPILTSGEMLSHPGGRDKPIPEVIHLWRHRTSMQNNLEKSRLVCGLDIFCTFLDKNEKNNQSPHWGRDSGIPSLCPRYATSTTRQASSWIANLGHEDGIPESLPQCGVRFYYSRYLYHQSMLT